MITTQNIRYVGFWKRVVAKLVDIVLLGFITYLFRLGTNISTDNDLGKIGAYISLACFYYALSWWKFSGTVGNYLLGQRVVNARFERPRPKEVATRVIIVILSECLLSLPFLSVAFDPRKQGIHDHAAGTFVVEAKSLTSTLRLADYS